MNDGNKTLPRLSVLERSRRMLLKEKRKLLPKDSPDQQTTGLGGGPSALVSSNSVIRAAACRRSLSVSFGRCTNRVHLLPYIGEQAGKNKNFVFVYRFVLLSLEREGFLSRASLHDLESFI